MIIRNYFSDSDDNSKLLIKFCPPNNATAVQAIQAFENFVGTVTF